MSFNPDDSHDDGWADGCRFGAALTAFVFLLLGLAVWATFRAWVAGVR